MSVSDGQDPWESVPTEEVGQLLPVRRLLASSPDAVIVLTDLIAYTSGFRFTIRWHAAPQVPRRGAHTMYVQGGDHDRVLRLGLRWSDGTKLTSVDEQCGISTSGAGLWPIANAPYGQLWWTWPLPPGGPLQVVCEWPVARIAVTAIELDGSAIRAAGLRSAPPPPKTHS